MRAVVVSAVGASVSFFAPAVDLRPALRPAVQPALDFAVQPAVDFAMQPAFQLPAYSAPQVVAVPSAPPADGPLRWFSYVVFGALCGAAAGSRLQPSVASLATTGQRSRSRVARTGRVFARTPRAAVRMAESPPPAGFVWAEEEVPAAEAATTPAASDMEGVVKASVATPAEASAATPTEAPKPKSKPKAKAKEPKREAWKEGIFAPLVLGAKQVMGDDELKQLRAAVITKHSKVIADFVDTSSSPFGQLVLKRMFEYADKDGNGTLDKEEVRSALADLGFDFLNEKQVAKVMENADADKNDVIDFEEFVKATPKTLRVNLVKLAKKNGHDLGFLV